MTSMAGSGVDPSGYVTVVTDEWGRLSTVSLHDVDESWRTEHTLIDAVQAAWRQALASTREPAPSRPAGQRPRAIRSPRPVHRPLDNWAATGRAMMPSAPMEPTGPAFGVATGASDNDCVNVRLHLGGPGGDMKVDQGWLQSAQVENVAKAITEAFADAYRRRNAHG